MVPKAHGGRRCQKFINNNMVIRAGSAKVAGATGQMSSDLLVMHFIICLLSPFEFSSEYLEFGLKFNSHEFSPACGLQGGFLFLQPSFSYFLPHSHFFW